MTRTYRWARRAVWGAVAVIFTLGCNPLATIAFLTHRDTPLPAKYPFVPPDDSKRSKDEITVAVFVSQSSSQSYEFAGAESTLASELARVIPELAKENKQKIKVIPPAEVNKFKFKNPTWKNMHASAWGKALGADFVLEVHLDKMRLYQPESRDQLYEGRAEVSVFMYDVKKGVAEPNNYIHPYCFPKTGFRDATTIPLGTFKKAFLERLAVEIAQYHIDHRPDSGIAEGR